MYNTQYAIAVGDIVNPASHAIILTYFIPRDNAERERERERVRSRIIGL